MKIGIIGAMEEEVVKFIDMFNLTKIDDKDIYEGTYANKEIIVLKSGIGKVNSAATTQYLIDTYKVDYIINSGCAGALTDYMKILDVIIASYVTYHDFKPIRIMNYSTPDNGHVKPSVHLVNTAKKVLDELDNTNYYVGPICSGDSFVTNKEMRDSIHKETGAIAVDMESASIGHISKKNNVPFLCIRTISDFANEEEGMEEVASYKNSYLVKNIIEEL